MANFGGGEVALGGAQHVHQPDAVTRSYGIGRFRSPRTCGGAFDQGRSLILARLCPRLVKRVDTGLSLNRALKEFAPRTYTRLLPGGGKIRLHVSIQMLRDAFNRWLSDPRPEALSFRYRNPNKKLSSPLAAEFIRRLAAPGVTSERGAYDHLLATWNAGDFINGVGSFKDWCRAHGLSGYRSAPDFPVGARQFYYLLSREDKKVLRQCFVARRRAIRADKKLATFAAAKAAACARRSQPAHDFSI